MKKILQRVAGAAVVSALFVAGSTGLALAQSTSTTDTTGTGTVGAPNTGAGGDSDANMVALAASAIVAAGGALYLARRRTALR